MKISILLLLLFSCAPCSNEVKLKIVKVGACDRHGYCGVLLEDGTIDTKSYPIEGQYIIKCRR